MRGRFEVRFNTQGVGSMQQVNLDTGNRRTVTEVVGGASHTPSSSPPTYHHQQQQQGYQRQQHQPAVVVASPAPMPAYNSPVVSYCFFF